MISGDGRPFSSVRVGCSPTSMYPTLCDMATRHTSFCRESSRFCCHHSDARVSGSPSGPVTPSAVSRCTDAFAISWQTFVRALLAKLTSDGALNNPDVVRSLVALSGPWLTVDQGFDAMTVAILAYGMRGIDYNASTFVTLPTAGVGTIAGASVVLPDYGGIAGVASALRDGRLAEYAAANGL